jgi:hypothetical protein
MKLKHLYPLIPVILLAPFLRPIPTDGLSMDDVFSAPANLINGVASGGGGEPERLPPHFPSPLPPIGKGERETPSNCLPPPPAPAQGDQPAQINARQVTMADEENTQQPQEQPQAPHPVGRTAGLKDPKAIALMNIAVPATGKSIIRHPRIKFPSYFDNETLTDYYRTRDGIIKVVHDHNDTVTAIEFAKQEG